MAAITLRARFASSVHMIVRFALVPIDIDRPLHGHGDRLSKRTALQAQHVGLRLKQTVALQSLAGKVPGRQPEGQDPEMRKTGL